ncbi:hypothetical protein HAHI6034_07300 [Hathewaya histolytica]|uniref:Uncharacterized protein n=1 Tax=Hathewaya histolytica TaxID=1498 RepID=A0A4V6KBH9_HATHI|nr:hypothetical protein [Hathewaya histolytica]VTQ82567.1 Uncharacterised protein [Hathewaya histolytica]
MNFYRDEDFEVMDDYGYEDEGYELDYNRQMNMPPMTQPGGGFPKSAPPKNVPQKSMHTAGRRSLCDCFNRFTYLWLRNGRAFWIWLVAVYDTYIICYRWNGTRWVSAQIDKRRIEHFIC